MRVCSTSRRIRRARRRDHERFTRDAPDVRDLVHGCIFTAWAQASEEHRVFIGGADMSAGEPFSRRPRKRFSAVRVSRMLDSNGSNTTAVAAAVEDGRAMNGSVAGQQVVVTAGTGPVGLRAAGPARTSGRQVRITLGAQRTGSCEGRIISASRDRRCRVPHRRGQAAAVSRGTRAPQLRPGRRATRTPGSMGQSPRTQVAVISTPSRRKASRASSRLTTASHAMAFCVSGPWASAISRWRSTSVDRASLRER